MNPTPQDTEIEAIIKDMWRDSGVLSGDINIVDDADKIAEATQKITALLTAARLDELERLYRKSEVIGVGYAIVREKHVTDRIKELQAQDGKV